LSNLSFVTRVTLVNRPHPSKSQVIDTVTCISVITDNVFSYNLLRYEVTASFLKYETLQYLMRNPVTGASPSEEIDT